MSHPIRIPIHGLSFECDLCIPGHRLRSYQLGRVIKDTRAQGFDFARGSLPHPEREGYNSEPQVLRLNQPVNVVCFLICSSSLQAGHRQEDK